MNKRIEELAAQCGFRSNPDIYDRNQSFDIPKFAELIVRECLNIVNRKEYSYHEADPLWETAQLIKQHFGVKE